MNDRQFLNIRSKSISVGACAPSILTSDGLCSPRLLAHIPPGVITKVGVVHMQKSSWKLMKPMTGERLVCLCCSKKNQCYCKKCTLEKLKLYSRKENISMRTIKKGELEKEVDDVLGEMSNLHAEINTTTANITLLRKWVSDKKVLNKIKADQLTMLKQLIDSTTRHTAKVLAYYNKHESNELYMQKRKAYKEAKVEDMNEQLSLIRKALCASLFSIFPVSEVIAHAADPDNESKKSTVGITAKWTVVSGHQIEEGPMVKIRDTFLSDSARERLGSALSNSVLNLSTDLRSTFAALLHSVQLVNSVAVVFDFRLPYLLSHHEISLRERWSQELLDNDWFKFCHSVLSLGLHLGMSPENLHFNYPHANIIEQARFVIEGGAVPKPHPLIMVNNRRFEINRSSSLGSLDERELISEWDTCEDLEL